MTRTACLFLFVWITGLSALPAKSETFSLDKTPAHLKPGLCASLRNSIIHDVNTQTYKWASKRKKEGKMWRKHKERLAFSEGLRRAMKQVPCGNIP